MTALNYMQVGDRGILMMDSATIDETGTLLELTPKGIELPEWGGFIASIGNVETAKAISQIVIPYHHGIDDLAANGEATFRTAREAMIAKYPDQFTAPWSAFVTAWSEEKQRTRAVYFGSNVDIFFDGDVTHWAEPFPQDDVWAAFRSRLTATGGRDSFDPIIHGLPLMQSQRERPLQDSDDGFAEGRHFVGGSVRVTEIGRDGVSHRIVHTWPEDKVGQMIQPASVATSNVVPMISRQQRRAIERQSGRMAG